MPHKKRVLSHLKRYGRITPINALHKYGCYRLSSVIHRLRQDGHKITTEIDSAQKYAIYRYMKK